MNKGIAPVADAASVGIQTLAASATGPGNQFRKFLLPPPRLSKNSSFHSSQNLILHLFKM